MLTLEKIGARIQQARIAAGMNQATLSEKLKDEGLHISRETISKIESGDRPLSALELPKFSSVLGVSVEVLIEEEATEDLVNLFRRKGDNNIVDIEISEIQDMIKSLIKQRKLHEGQLVIRKREPRWKV